MKVAFDGVGHMSASGFDGVSGRLVGEKGVVTVFTNGLLTQFECGGVQVILILDAEAPDTSGFTFTSVLEHLFTSNSSDMSMVAEAIQYVSNHLDTIMTGLTMAVVGISVYEARDGFFLFNGNFQGKYGALLIFLGTLFGASLITPMVSNLWQQSLPYIPPGQLLGAVLVLGMLAVNKAAEWNFFDTKSLPVYGLGLVLIANPELLHTVA